MAILITIKNRCQGKKNTRQKGTLNNAKKVNSLKDITILNVYSPNKKASSYIKQKLIELREVNKSTIIIGDFALFFSVIYKTSGLKIIKDIKT